MATLSARELSDIALRHADAAGGRAERAIVQAGKAIEKALAAFERALILQVRLSRRGYVAAERRGPQR